MILICIAFSLILLAAGLTKVAGMNVHKTHFRHWNLPEWFMYLTGALEVVAGISILFPKTEIFGLILSSFILFGAVVTCWIMYDYKRSLLPFGLLLLACSLLWQLAAYSTLSFVVFGILGFGLLLAALLWLYPSTAMNSEGEVEKLEDGTQIMHHFEKALGVDYHYVTAGNQTNPVIVILPGAPESWYCFHHQISALSKKYHIVAIDLKPYGQTGKDLDGDHSYSHIAKEIKALLDQIGINDFFLMGHDRGAVTTDHLLSLSGMTERVKGYIRMQQSFNEPHGEPVPPHHLMSNFAGSAAFKIRFGMYLVYVKSAYTKLSVPSKDIQRITKEFQFKGIAQAVPLSFKTTNFAKEKQDREDKLFAFMTMPILILQGRYDPGQHPEEYENSHTIVPNLRVEFIEAGHFFHIEAPELANRAILNFLADVQKG